METGCQRHFGIMHVGAVLQQGNSHTRREFTGQHLLVQCRTGNLLSLLSDEQRESILRSTNLTTEVVGLRLCGQVGCFGTLHADRTHAPQLMLQLHHLPRFLGHLGHLRHNAQLLVEHQQRVVAVGNTADNLCAHSHLVVLHT